MSILDDVKGKAFEFLWGIALKKGLKAGSKALIAWVASLALEQYGISITFNEGAFIAGAATLLEMARNYAKHKWGFGKL